MTAVERLPTDLTPAQARELFDEIKGDLAVPLPKLERAFLGRAWLGLGYSSWQECCAREFESARLKLTPTERQDAVASLRESGFSIPAIAAATGLGVGTIHRALPSPSPFPNGKPDLPDEADDFFLDLGSHNRHPDGLPRDDPAPQTSKVTGMDGKQYSPKGTSRLSSRAPLPTFALKTGVDLRRLVERLERIATDDRLNSNREQIGVHLRSHLTHAIDICSNLLDQLNQEKPQ